MKNSIIYYICKLWEACYIFQWVLGLILCLLLVKHQEEIRIQHMKIGLMF